MTQLTDNHFAIPMPEGSKKHHIGCTLKIATSNDQSIFYKYKDDDELDEWTILDLPPGSYEFLFCTKGASEEQAKKVVERTHPGGFGRSSEEFKHYNGAGVCFNAKYSLETLLRSKGLDGKKNYALIQKILK